MTADISKGSDHNPNRTDLANDRTILAAERTLSAWWRTAMAALAAAVGFARIFGDVQPQWLVRGGASCLIALALLILAIALLRYRRTAKRIDNQEVHSVSMSALVAGTALLVVAAAAAALAIWLL
jgi:putative membrane protein